MYEIHKLTGDRLVGSDGTSQGAESAGVISRWPTLDRARREMAALSRMGGGINRGKYQIRDAAGEPVSYDE